MSSNLPLVCRSRRGRGGRKLEINIPPQQIHANSKGELIIEGGVMSSEYSKCKFIYKMSESLGMRLTANDSWVIVVITDLHATSESLGCGRGFP